MNREVDFGDTLQFELRFALLTAMWMLPLSFIYAYCVIVNGRLTGAFVEGEDRLDSHVEQDFVAKAAAEAKPGLVGDGVNHPTQSQATAFNFDDIVNQVKSLNRLQ